MRPAHSYRFRNQQLWLSPDRIVFWEEKKALIASDLHFGKTGHFRKSGVAVPQTVYKEDLQRLLSQIQYFQPQKLVVVGDLFHSRLNKELDLFRRWRENFPGLDIHLVKGNHDILESEWYEQAGITVSHPELFMHDFQFVHDINLQPVPARQKGGYVFSGHIHPGIRISGPGRQSLCFPCFYFGRQFAVLPAFSRFTGVALIDPKKNENVFAIVEDKILQFQ